MAHGYSFRPRFGKIPAAMQYSGRGRNKLYEWAAQHQGLFRKDGASTLVDFDILDQILDGLPVATVKPPTHNKPETMQRQIADQLPIATIKTPANKSETMRGPDTS